MPELGELEDVALRDVWPDESKDFTPWMASNLSLLNKTLGLALETDLCRWTGRSHYYRLDRCKFQG